MKTRNVNLENSSILTNHIFKHIILEAPTDVELEKKLKNYEMILAKALTNAYHLSNLTLEREGYYHISPNGSFQTVLVINFDGQHRQAIAEPKRTLQYLKQLTALESKKHQSFPLIKNANLPQTLNMHSETVAIDVEPDDIDEAISRKQRELLEKLISQTNLFSISFVTGLKRKDEKTGKVHVSMLTRYECRDLWQKHSGLSAPEDSGR